MTKERGLTAYLNDWNVPNQSGESRNNASGADSDARPEGRDYDGGVPARWPMPENEEYGYAENGNSGGYGHSSDCRDVGQKGAAWGMSQSDIARGYEGPEKYDDGVYAQDIPEQNIHDRGSGSESYSREHSATTGVGFNGRGTMKTRSGLGSMTIKPGNQAD